MSGAGSHTVTRPLDLVRLSVDERVTVKCKNDREIKGKLHVRRGGGGVVADVGRWALCATVPLRPPTHPPFPAHPTRRRLTST